MKFLKLSLLTIGLVIFVSCNSNAQSNNRPSGGEQGGGQGEKKGPPPSADEIFEMMDVDKNGQLELSEVKGPIKNDFTTIDTNEDGYISKEELETAPKPERQGGQERR